jgi:LPS export ABC transporter protein LptC
MIQVILLGSALALGPGFASARTVASSSLLHVTGMTFVGSRGSVREVVLRSRRAIFRPEERVADLREVNALVTEDSDGRSFSMTCDRAELNIETNDFTAEGDVQGETGDGQRYWAPWVRYDHDDGVLYTDAPVRVVDATGHFRGDGFRYHVHERRFQLLGNVRVEQAQ